MKLEIDYAQHPAFRAPQRYSATCPIIGRYFADLDNLWDRLVHSEAAGADIADAFYAGRQHLMERIAPELTEFTDPAYRPFLVQAFDRSADAIIKEISRVVGARTARGRQSGDAEAIADELRDVSIVGFPIEPALRARIAKSLSPYMDQLRAQRRSNGGARCFVAVPSWGEHWQLIKKFLKRNRIEEGVSAYAGYPLELSGYALTYSHSDESWFKHCYADIGLVAPGTVQMHFDEENTSAKSMLYLNDIDCDNGPFSYVPRNELKIPSRSQLSFFKCLDYANADFARAQAVNGGTYNRALFNSPQLRPHFARLPAELQGSSCLGDDILDGTPMSTFLLGKERQITSSVGDFALFAGGETLHRGGIVRRGERWALQMIYKQPLSRREKALQLTTSFLIRARNRYRELMN
jgi:hypothetical protein